MAIFGLGKKPASKPASPVRQPSSDLERRAVEIGKELLAPAGRIATGIFSTRFWSDQLMNWAMKDPAFKVQLFRFIDVFPMLGTPDLVHDYLIDYLTQPGVTLPPGMDLGLKAGGLAKGMMTKTISKSITTMAGNFIAGDDADCRPAHLEETLERRRGLQRRSAGRSLRERRRGRGVPAAVSRTDRDSAREVAAWPPNPLLETDYLGADSADQRLDQDQFALRRTDPIDFEGSLRALAGRACGRSCKRRRRTTCSSTSTSSSSP